MTKPIAKGPVETTALTPAQIAQLRHRIGRTVHEALPHAREVLKGERKWSPVQLGLFRALLGKIVPDLNQSFAQVEVAHRPLSQLSRAELEAIAAGDTNLSEVEVEAAEAAVSAASDESDAASVSAQCDQTSERA